MTELSESSLINSLLDRRPGLQTMMCDCCLAGFDYLVCFVCLAGLTLALVAQHLLPPATAVTHWRHFRLTEEEELNEEAGGQFYYLELQSALPPCRYLQLLPGSGATQARGVPYQTPSRAGGASKHHQPLSRLL